jgi:hypothetical protein
VAKTLEVIKFRDIIRVASITRFVPNLLDPTIELTGEDFSSVESVSINDVPAPEFFIVNQSTIWAQLPDGQESIRTVSVVSANFTRTALASIIDFKIGTKTKGIEGVLKLTQLFTKWILQSPGTDVYNPERGGGLQDIAGRMSSTHKVDPILGSIARSVEKTANEIRRAQLAVGRLPLSERLLAATLVDVAVAAPLQEARAKVRIDNMAGDSAVSAMQL